MLHVPHVPSALVVSSSTCLVPYKSLAQQPLVFCVPRILRAFVPYVPCFLRALFPYVPHALSSLVPHVTCVLCVLKAPVPCVSWAFFPKCLHPF